MEFTVTATELARKLGDVLGRVRYRQESFVVERNGVPVARVVPVDARPVSSAGEALAASMPAAPADPTFAGVERVNSVVEVYKRDIDRTLLRENLKLTPEQRLRRLQEFVNALETLRQQARTAR